MDILKVLSIFISVFILSKAAIITSGNNNTKIGRSESSAYDARSIDAVDKRSSGSPANVMISLSKFLCGKSSRLLVPILTSILGFKFKIPIICGVEDTGMAKTAEDAMAGVEDMTEGFLKGNIMEAIGGSMKLMDKAKQMLQEMLHEPSKLMNDQGKTMDQVSEMLNDPSKTMNHLMKMVSDPGKTVKQFTDVISDPKKLMNNVGKIITEPQKAMEHIGKIISPNE